MSAPNDLNEVAHMAARSAVREFTQSEAFKEALTSGIQSALEKAGMNVTTPEAREALRQDMIHLRTWREFTEFAKKKGIGATITWVVAGGLSLLIAGIVVSLHR